ncbi:MAG TPA: GatB/YqeY domain-containing protein [Bacteroidales bacterium]|nr:GatB/YqeY domain-containing protein [Bacteroidales bacterium]HPU46556.1 GatB/YqeY domain-containing protein [Bacteroidales bacterium]HPZ36241.1 GatB/YqeY domain-containing protein [Bacteroidales bacterium]HQD34506.1 GatB/YqeY domain-containing protein [Bacteroidales bacterium]HXK90873.1 GatB/YqeY domain-containing protein [Bacteroidales bacterium]
MSLIEKITKDIMAAMKNHESDKLDALKAIKSALLLAQTEGNAKRELTEADEIKVLQRLYKQRIESAEIYNNNNRTDLADIELSQAAIIKTYLPAQLSDEEIENEVKKVINELNATSIKDMGKVMSVVSKSLAGKADNATISNIVKKLLS